MVDKQPKQETVETPEASPAENKTPETDANVNDVTLKKSSSSKQKATATEGEIPEKGASEKTQTRIRRLIRERDEALSRLNKQAQADLQSVPQTQPVSEPAPAELQEAVQKLDQHGMATKDYVEKTVNDRVSRIETDRKHGDLEQKYTGTDGLPKYDRDEVEDYARKNSIWNLEAAFHDMYFDEFVDAGKRSTRKSNKVVTEKPRAAMVGSRQQPMTLDELKKKLSGPDGMKFYEKMQKSGKLDAVIQTLTEEA